MSRKPRTLRLLAAVPLVAFACAAGCSTVDGDLSPEMMTLASRRADVSNRAALTIDTNYRQWWEDWVRISLLDRPMRLTPAPVSH